MTTLPTDEAAAPLVASGRNIFDMSAHPIRHLPPHVLAAVVGAAASNGVPLSRGLLALQAIAEGHGRIAPQRRSRLRGPGPGWRNSGVGDTLATLLAPGKEAVAPVPNFFLDWFFDRQDSRLVGAPCEPSVEYAVDWDLLEQRITDRTRMLFVTTSASPTGYVLQTADLDART